MDKFTKIIELLLQEKADLAENMELEIEVAVNDIKARYAECTEKIEAMLSLAGYEQPADEELGEINVEETTADAVEEKEATSGNSFYTL